MSKTLQIRDVPDEFHDTVRARAAQADLSVSDYLYRLLDELVSRPTMTEVTARAEALSKAGGGASRADIKAAVRAGRDR